MTDTSSAEPNGTKTRRTRTRGGGRQGNARRGGPAIRQYPWQAVINNDRPTELATACQQVETIALLRLKDLMP